MGISIERAIENLAAGREDCGMIPSDEFTQTIDLAGEGLKAIQRSRDDDTPLRCSMLPGETLVVPVLGGPEEEKEDQEGG